MKTNKWNVGLLFCLFLAVLIPATSALDTATVLTVQTEVRAMIDASAQGRPLLATLVRLAFHDCAGGRGCDGCVNLALAANRGLQNVVTLLNALHQNQTLGLSGKISKADLFALAGTVAANYGASLVPPPPRGQPPIAIPSQLLPLSFQWGRTDTVDCSSSEVEADFPGASPVRFPRLLACAETPGEPICPPIPPSPPARH